MAHLWRRISVAAAAFVLMTGVLGAARQRVIQPSPFPRVAVVVAARHLQTFSAIRPAQLPVVHQGWSPALLGLAGTPRQLLNDVPAGQSVPAADIGPTMPRRTVARAVTLKPAESLAASIGPGDTINVIPVCTDEDPPDDWGRVGVGVGSGVCMRLPSAALAGLGTVTWPRKARENSRRGGETFPARGRDS